MIIIMTIGKDQRLYFNGLLDKAGQANIKWLIITFRTWNNSRPL